MNAIALSMKKILTTATLTSMLSAFPAYAADINLICTLYDTGQKYTTTFRISGDSATVETSSCMPGECIYKAIAFVRPTKIDIKRVDIEADEFSRTKHLTIFSIDRTNGKVTESVDYSIDGVSKISYINKGSCQKASQQQNLF